MNHTYWGLRITGKAREVRAPQPSHQPTSWLGYTTFLWFSVWLLVQEEHKFRPINYFGAHVPQPLGSPGGSSWAEQEVQEQRETGTWSVGGKGATQPGAHGHWMLEGEYTFILGREGSLTRLTSDEQPLMETSTVSTFPLRDCAELRERAGDMRGGGMGTHPFISIDLEQKM